MKEVFVEYMALPAIKDGVASFYSSFEDNKCVEPAKDYVSGRCHTVGEELDELAISVGFMTLQQFQEIHGVNSLNTYGYQLSIAVGRALLGKGIVLNIDGEDVLFRCNQNKFYLWPKSKREYLYLEEKVQSF
ncbi:hypothetical protein [Lysinibacillus sp. BW-2-10]|uniref:hypothetical protein n=1 Tax=Lysinibacillus sp. BW-2-10 TaxID=2590030 RepID=UPI00117BF588|nr:hypothetical protein [Lysinibacillus sp. BW-2-10]TSI05112.1 hypothetical protein FJQ64_12400 [Lysinibacillus sp. BW-2-10]